MCRQIPTPSPQNLVTVLHGYRVFSCLRHIISSAWNVIVTDTGRDTLVRTPTAQYADHCRQLFAVLTATIHPRLSWKFCIAPAWAAHMHSTTTTDSMTVRGCEPCAPYHKEGRMIARMPSALRSPLSGSGTTTIQHALSRSRCCAAPQRACDYLHCDGHIHWHRLPV